MPIPVSRTQQIVDDITALIASGELQPGDPIPSARELRAQYGVSITPVRLAMRELKAKGLVTGVPGVRVFVAERS